MKNFQEEIEKVRSLFADGKKAEAEEAAFELYGQVCEVAEEDPEFIDPCPYSSRHNLEYMDAVAEHMDKMADTLDEPNKSLFETCSALLGIQRMCANAYIPKDARKIFLDFFYVTDDEED